MFMLMSFVFGFGMAATILIGQAFGRRDIEEARRVMGTAIGSFTLVAIAVGALGWIFAPQLLGVLGTPEAARPLALSYLRVIFLAMPGMLIMVMLMMTLRGSGERSRSRSAGYPGDRADPGPAGFRLPRPALAWRGCPVDQLSGQHGRQPRPGHRLLQARKLEAGADG